MRGVYEIDLHGWESRVLICFHGKKVSEPQRYFLEQRLVEWGKDPEDVGKALKRNVKVAESNQGCCCGDNRDSIIFVSVDDKSFRGIRKTLCHELEHHVTKFFEEIVGYCKRCQMTEPRSIFAGVLFDDALAALDDFTA